MAIYSTLFLSEPDQLEVGFPDWRLPLPAPVVRTSINPFTREEVSVTTRAPDWDDVEFDDSVMPEAQVVAIEGDYGAYLESRIPGFVRSQPHWCGKNLTSVELEPLVEVAMANEKARLETALYAHPSLAKGIEQFPDSFTAQMKTVAGAMALSLAERWAGRMSTPEFTHSVSGERLVDDWTVDDALNILNPVLELARQQVSPQSMYLLTEA